MEQQISSLDEARSVLRGVVQKWVAMVQSNGLRLCPFTIVHAGSLADENAALTIALYAELIEERGFEIVSHSILDESPAASRIMLLARAPRIVS